VRELANHGGRRVADRCKLFRQFGAGLGLDLGDQTAQHVIEQADVILIEPACAIEEERRDALERLGPPFGRAMLDDLFEFGNQ